MNKYIELYRENELKKIEHTKDEKIIAIKTEDPVYASLRAAKKSIRNADAVVSLRGYKFSDEVNARIEAVRTEQANAIDELNTRVAEISMMVDTAPTTSLKLSVLKTYGVVDSHGKLIK